jgi:outer membrane protein OmpA-like peptidoglycan-associated protein
MKSKLVILSLLLAGAASTVSAQTKEKYYCESWKDNFFVSVGAGIQATANPDTKFGKSITPLVNVSLGKYVTPVWGIRGQVYGWNSKQKTAYPFPNTGERVKRDENYVGLNLDGVLNLTNLFCGYKPNRVFEGILFVGPSVNFTKNYGHFGYDNDVTTGEIVNVYPTSHKLRSLVGASVGLGAKFYVNNSLSIDLEARGQVTPSILGAYSSSHRGEGYVHLTAGLSYTFGGRKFVSTKCEQQAINDDVNKIREVVVEKPVEKIVEKEVEKEIAGPLAVFFKIGSAKIDDYGKVNIGLIAKAIKESDSTYKVSGYCDIATGSSNTNKVLSEKRAQAVYDALIAEGVSKDQLELEGFGGTENMFGKDRLNRVVIIEAK